MMAARKGFVLVVLGCLLASAAGFQAGAGTDTSGDWQRLALGHLERIEYDFGSMGEGSWVCANRAHAVRGIVSADGLRLVPRRPGEESWEVGLHPVRFGRPGAWLETGDLLGPPVADGNRLELPRAAFTEWYVNDFAGLEQGFTVPRPPAGSRSGGLVLEMSLSGPVVADLAPDGRELLFRTASGSAVLRYGGLWVVDAEGRELPSRFELAGNRLRIVTDDRDAVYPVIIDPLVTDPDWSAESNQSGASFGVSVASAGDVNGDGFDDVIVGSDDFSNSQADEGVVFVYHGSAGGPSVTPNWTVESDHPFAKFGRSVATAGDVNGDGYDDIVIGAPEYDDDDGSLLEVDEGWAFFFYGSSGGLPNGPNTTVASADWTAEANQEEGAFGRFVASAGDVNGDGYDDVLIGASDYSNGQSFEGASFLYLGSSTGLGATGTPANADWSSEGDQVNSLYGHALASAGDVNADGYDDVIIGARNYENNFEDEGRVELFLGSAAGLALTPVWRLDGGQNDMRLGVSVDSAGDVNGDGYDDVLIGADIFSNGQTGEGGAFVFAGSQSANLGTIPAWTGEINQGDAFLGFSAAGVGDVNQDGFDDVIVGADGYDNGSLDEGAAFLYLGSVNGPANTPSRSFEIDVSGARFGLSVAGAGDVNGDGYDDVIVGADRFTRLQVEEGGAFVYFGCQDNEPDGVCELEDNCPGLSNPDQEDGDLDGIGDVCDPCEDVDMDGVCDQPRVLVESSGPGEQVLVEFGSAMRYLPNVELVNPGIVLQWTQLTFPAEGFLPWAVGVYGVGYETDVVGGADDLLLTTNPPDPGTVSIFSRAQFSIGAVNDVKTLFLGMDWDDGYVAWINGVEVYRSSSMPSGVPLWNTKATPGHESSNGAVPDYGELQDISFAGIPALKTGLNVLAVGVWNTSGSSSDLILVPRLSINRPKTHTMHYLANDFDPALGSSWTATSYDEVLEGWTPGNYGVGFEASTGAEDLVNTEVPTSTVSVFTRSRFNVEPATVDSVFLGADYDNAYVAWINGTEVYRSPEIGGASGDPVLWDADPAPTHESSNGAVPDYSPLIDITGLAKPVLFTGENVLAIGGWNGSTDTDDLVLVPRLSINEGNVDNCITVNDQTDGDQDGLGDLCDSCPDDAANDLDGDGICVGIGFNAPMVGDQDNCPLIANPPEDCDGLPGTPDEQCDLDDDGEGDVCDSDVDGDGEDNGTDNCPWTFNDTQDDGDIDGVGDACDCASGNDQAWVVPATIETLKMTKQDLCGSFSCLESEGACAGNTDCEFDHCENLACSQSLGPCVSDTECEVDSCEDFTCSEGDNSCNSDVDCTADFCANRLCSAGGNSCSGNLDCTADSCENKMCLETHLPCASHFNCFGGPGDLCIGECSVGTNLCATDSVCTADVCGDGTCSVGTNVCTDDSVCTADVCEGQCTVGPNSCTDDAECTAPQTDLCEGICTLGTNTCGGDVDCTLPQTDLCQGSCTIGSNSCSSDSACVQPAVDTLFWLDPAQLGGTSVVFDTLRSSAATDFGIPATCLDTDGLDRQTADATDPPAGVVRYYLIRSENECPDGNMGSGANGTRTGKVCE